MAKINSGITGGLSGTLDNVICYRRKGVNIISGRTIIKERNVNSSLLTRAEILKLASYKFETHEGMFYRVMNFLGQGNRVNHKNILKSISQNGVYNNPEFSGPFYFKSPDSAIHLPISFIFIPATRVASVSFLKWKSWSGQYQDNRYGNAGMVQSMGIPFVNLVAQNSNTITVGGSYNHFALNRIDTLACTMRNSSGQWVGDTLIYTVRKLS
jgi:hypothetical protein